MLQLSLDLVAMEMCLQSHCLTTAAYATFTIPAMRRCVTNSVSKPNMQRVEQLPKTEQYKV
jgi:hypothetical protein